MIFFLNSGQWWSITSCSPSVGPLEKCLGSGCLEGFSGGFAAEFVFQGCATLQWIRPASKTAARDGVSFSELGMGQ